MIIFLGEIVFFQTRDLLGEHPGMIDGLNEFLVHCDKTGNLLIPELVGFCSF